jgi:hypothetical protein
VKYLLWFGLLAGLAGAAGCGSGQSKRAVVKAPVLDMQSGPRRQADVVSQARLGQEVEILMRREGWWKVKTPDGYEGFVRPEGLRTLPEGASYPANGTRQVVVESLFARLYVDPSVTRHPPLLTAPYETRLEVAEEKGERWLRVRLPDGGSAWVQRGDVEEQSKKEDVSGVIAHARRFLGLPYTWGGTSSYGYDCSGFTQMLCRRGGRDIPRDAKPQALWEGMKPVEKAALEPGDLLYFGPSLEKINHTGFYIGNGEFIHSTTNTHPVVQISRLEEPYWTSRFVCARRWRQE